MGMQSAPRFTLVDEEEEDSSYSEDRRLVGNGTPYLSSSAFTGPRTNGRSSAGGVEGHAPSPGVEGRVCFVYAKNRKLRSDNDSSCFRNNKYKNRD